MAIAITEASLIRVFKLRVVPVESYVRTVTVVQQLENLAIIIYFAV